MDLDSYRILYISIVILSLFKKEGLMGNGGMGNKACGLTKCFIPVPSPRKNTFRDPLESFINHDSILDTVSLHAKSKIGKTSSKNPSEHKRFTGRGIKGRDLLFEGRVCEVGDKKTTIRGQIYRICMKGIDLRHFKSLEEFKRYQSMPHGEICS